jgi:hypothetical protein
MWSVPTRMHHRPFSGASRALRGRRRGSRPPLVDVAVRVAKPPSTFVYIPEGRRGGRMVEGREFEALVSVVEPASSRADRGTQGPGSNRDSGQLSPDSPNASGSRVILVLGFNRTLREVAELIRTRVATVQCHLEWAFGVPVPRWRLPTMHDLERTGRAMLAAVAERLEVQRAIAADPAASLGC